MRRTFASWGCMAVAAWGTCAGAAVADSPPGPSYKSLPAGRYEIKAVTMVPLDAAKQLGGDTSHPEAVVTLQNGTSTAVCTFDFANWYNRHVPSMEGTSECVAYTP